MATDIILDDHGGDWLTLSASVVNCAAADLLLDHPQRRGAGARGFRRALVHDQTDGLTINFNGDYPGGVTLNGVHTITPTQPAASGGALGRMSLRTVSHVNIAGGINFLWDHGISVVRGGGPHSESVNLQSVIAALQTEVEALRQRVQALEAR